MKVDILGCITKKILVHGYRPESSAVNGALVDYSSLHKVKEIYGYEERKLGELSGIELKIDELFFDLQFRYRTRRVL